MAEPLELWWGEDCLCGPPLDPLSQIHPRLREWLGGQLFDRLVNAPPSTWMAPILRVAIEMDTPQFSPDFNPFSPIDWEASITRQILGLDREQWKVAVMEGVKMRWFRPDFDVTGAVRVLRQEVRPR